MKIKNIDYDSSFWLSAKLNGLSYQFYAQSLINMCIGQFKYINLPENLSSYYMESYLLYYGSFAWFYDDLVGLSCLPYTNIGGFLDNYGCPLEITVFSPFNNYRKNLKKGNFVITYNNPQRSSSFRDILYYSQRLWSIDQAIDVNINAQKTPVLIICDEKQRLSLKNAYKKFSGNVPVIFGNKNTFDKDCITSISTGAPFVADKMFKIRDSVYNEFILSRGIYQSTDKKERLITSEVENYNNACDSVRYSLLGVRRDSLKSVNEKFGTHVEVENV